MGNESFVIPDAELPAVQHQALQGSPDAAFRLYQYFEMVELDYHEGLYWASIAAENGHPGGQYAFGFMLNEDWRASLVGRSNPPVRERDRQRARFWLRRSAENGNGRAVELLKEIGE